MTNSLVLNNNEAVELILGFYTFTLGYWEDELDEIPEVKQFVTMGFAKKDEEYNSLYTITKEGEEILHEYIEKYSLSLIDFANKNELVIEHSTLVEWFKNEFNLCDNDDSKFIVEYLCGNLHNYKYRVKSCYSQRKGDYYRFEKI